MVAFPLQPLSHAYNARYMNEVRNVGHEVAEDGTLLDGDYVQDRPKVAVVRTDPLAIGVLIVLSLLVAAGIAFILTHNNTAREKAEAVMPVHTPVATPQPVATTTPVVLEDVNTTSILPTSWRTTRRAPMLPTGITQPDTVYTNAETGCILVYTPFVPQTGAVTYTQNATPTDVFSGTILKGRIEYRNASTTHGKEYIALSYSPLFYDNGKDDGTNNAWVLFANELTEPDQACIDDLTLLLRSQERAYEQHEPSPKDRGNLFIETHGRLGTLLLFRTEKNPETLMVTPLDSGNIFRPTLVDTTLYFVGTKGRLKTYSMSGNRPPEILPLPLNTEDSVHDFSVGTSSIEYLSGTWCREDSAPCTLTHTRYDMATASTTILDTDVIAPDLPSNATYVRTNVLTITSGTATSSVRTIPGFVTARVPIRVK